MSRLLAVLLLSLVFLAAPLWAQMPQGYSKGTIRVEIMLANGHHVGAGVRVQLREGLNNSPLAVNMTNSAGDAEFSDLNPGSYSVKVTGDTIEPTESDNITIEDGRAYQTVTVTVKSSGVNDPGAEVRASASSVAAVDLNVPKKAAKEFEKGDQEIGQGNYDKAIEHLNKALEIYPQYSSAYNDLAVCYGRQGQKDKQREALQKAISINDHCFPALVNLAHMDMKDRQLGEAVRLLDRATAGNPNNVEALSLLAQVDFMEGHYDDAIAQAHKVHGLPHERFAIVHYTAASAFERENQIPNAIAELQLFLQEEPKGARSDVVRKAMVAMQSQAQNQPPGPSQGQAQTH